MEYNVYSVKDKKIGYMNTWCAENDNVAKRDFGDAINDPRSTLNRHPYDMELWRVGTWNDKTAEIKSDIEYLCSGVDYYVERKENKEIVEETKETTKNE